MGSAGDFVEISSDDEEEIPVAAKLPHVPFELASHPRREDCNGIGEGLDDHSVFDEILASLLDDTKPACDVTAADVDGDDDDCVMLDGDPDKALVVVKEGRTGEDGPEEELQIVAEKGELACRDFPHPRHLCASIPFRTSSHANHCTMCHCYVCDCPAPCANWGKGTEPTDHCHATDKDSEWTKMRQSFKQNSQPASKRKYIQNFFQPASTTVSLQQYTGARLPVSQSSPRRSGVAQPSPVGFHVSSDMSQNQWWAHMPTGVEQNMRQVVCLPKTLSPRPNISHKRFRRDGAAPPVYSPTNANHLRPPVPNFVMVQPAPSAGLQGVRFQPASSAVLQTVQSQPASAVFQNSLTDVGVLQRYPLPNSPNVPVISQGLGVQSASYLQVAPGIPQGLGVQPTSYPRAASGSAVRTDLQLSRCSSLPTQGTQCQQDPSTDVNRKRLHDILASLASELGVSDYNINPHRGQQSTSIPEPSQQHAQMRPDPLLTQLAARQGVEANHSPVATASQMRPSNGYHLPNHRLGDDVHDYGSMMQTIQPLSQLNSQSSLPPSETS